MLIQQFPSIYGKKNSKNTELYVNFSLQMLWTYNILYLHSVYIKNQTKVALFALIRSFTNFRFLDFMVGKLVVQIG